MPQLNALDRPHCGYGFTFNIAVLVTSAGSFAVIVTAVLAATTPPWTVNVAEVAPAGNVTLVGTGAAFGSEEERETVKPIGAGPFKLSFPVEIAPITIVEGLNESPERVGGF